MERPFAFALLVLTAVAAVGCNTLPPGPIGRLTEQSTSSDNPAGEAYLLRGWRGLWSEGVDTLAGELRTAGLRAEVFRADQKRDLAQALAQRCAMGMAHRPLVLIGFSYGADDAIEVANDLGKAGFGVDLLITIDPVTPPPLPDSVLRCRNYYQSNGLWDTFPWLRGIPLPAPAGRTGEPIVNCNIRDRADLVECGTSHATIAGNEKLHLEIIQQALRVTR